MAPSTPAGTLRSGAEDGEMRSCTWDVCCLLSAAHLQAAPLFMSTSASPEASDRKTEVFALPKKASFAPCYLCQGMLYSPGAMCVHPEASAGVTSAIQFCMILN